MEGHLRLSMLLNLEGVSLLQVLRLPTLKPAVNMAGDLLNRKGPH